MKMKSLFKRGLCSILSGAIILSGLSLPAQANTISLTQTEVNENQDFYGYSYNYKGEEKTIYIYNTEYGTAKMTGDIIFTTGLYDSECRHIEGYVDIPFSVIDFSVAKTYNQDNQYNIYECWDMLFLNDENELYTFNDTINSLDTKQAYINEEEFTMLSYNVTEVEGSFYLREDKQLYSINSEFCLSSDIEQFMIIDDESQVALCLNTQGYYFLYSANVIRQIGYENPPNSYKSYIEYDNYTNNSITFYDLDINGVTYLCESTLYQFKQLTPQQNGVTSEYYDLPELLVTKNTDTNSYTFSVTNGTLFFDYENVSLITDYGTVSLNCSSEQTVLYGGQFNVNFNDANVIYENVEYGLYGSSGALFWDASITNSEVSYTLENTNNIGFTFKNEDTNYICNVLINFETNIIETYSGPDASNLTYQTHNIITTTNNTKQVNLIDCPTIFAITNNNIILTYNINSNQIDVIYDYNWQIHTKGLKTYTSSKLELTQDDIDNSCIEYALVDNIKVTKYVQTHSQNNVDYFLPKELFESFKYIDTFDSSYFINQLGVLRKIKCNRTQNGQVFISSNLINNTKEVVKVTKNYYLTNDGQMYNYNNELICTGISNIYDEAYLKDDKYYKYNNQEFLFDYATDYNVNFLMCDDYPCNDYYIKFNEEEINCITFEQEDSYYTVTEDDELITITEYPCVFTITNKYGDTFTKTLLNTFDINHKETHPTINVLNNIVSFKSENNIILEYSYDLQTWYTYDASIYYTQPFYYQYKYNNNKTGDVFYFELIDGKYTISNITQKYIGADQFCGYGYIDSQGDLYDIDGNYIDSGVFSAAFYSINEYVYANRNADFVVNSISNRFNSVFDSEKHIYESEIQHPIKMLLDDTYCYLVGQYGNVIRSSASGAVYGASNLVYAQNWNNEWLGNDFNNLSSTGTLTYDNNKTIETGYSTNLGIPFSSLNLYTQSDIDTYGNGFDLTNVPTSTDTIIAVRVVYDGYIALTQNGRVYMYDGRYGLNGAMVFTDIVLKDTAFQTDIIQTETNWTNENVTIMMKESENSSIYNTITNFENSIYKHPTFGDCLTAEWRYNSGEYVHFNVEEPTTLTFTCQNSYVDYDARYGSTFVIYYDEYNNNSMLYADKIYNEEGMEIQYSQIGEWNTYEYTLLPGNYAIYNQSYTYTKDIYSLNGIEYKFSDVIYDECESPYRIWDENLNSIRTQWDKENKAWFVTLPNGQYYMSTYYDNKFIDKTKVIINNIDIINPSIESYSINNNTLTFIAKDNDGENSAISGIDKIYYSTDNVSFVEIQSEQKIVYSDTMTLSEKIVTVPSRYVYMYTTDKAGNNSDVQMFDLKTVTPALTASPIVNNSITLIPIDGYGVQGPASEIDKTYISIDNQTYVEIDTTKMIVYDETVSMITINDNYIKVPTKSITGYTVDINGNRSPIMSFTIYLELFEEFIYSNGNTAINFYANDDIQHNNAQYTYYIVDTIENNTFTKSYDEDITVTIKVQFIENGILSEKIEIVNIKVLNADAPTILKEDINSVKILASNDISHTQFNLLWISIDNQEYTKTTIEEVIKHLTIGTHTIKAYQTNVFEQNNSIYIDSDITEFTIDIQVSIIPELIYKNGQTTINFYANDDTNYTNPLYSYSIIENNSEDLGHNKTYTQDTEVVLKTILSEDGISSSITMPMPIKVVKNPTPAILVGENGNVTVKANPSQNSDFKELWINIDNQGFVKYSDTIVDFTLPVGSHSIKAYQTVTLTDNLNVIISSNITEKEMSTEMNLYYDLSYDLGKTTISFYADNDINHTSSYYTYQIIDKSINNQYVQTYTDDCTITLKVIKNNNGIISELSQDVSIKVVKTNAPIINMINDINVQVERNQNISNATFKTLWISINGQDYFEVQDISWVQSLDYGTYTIKAYQTVQLNNSNLIFNSDEAIFNITLDKPTPPTPPVATGDTNLIPLFVSLGGVTLIVLLILMFVKRKSKNSETIS